MLVLAALLMDWRAAVEEEEAQERCMIGRRKEFEKLSLCPLFSGTEFCSLLEEKEEEETKTERERGLRRAEHS